jgi:hypothetical protein
MIDLSQEVRVQQALPPATYTSVQAGDYLNMENYAKATLVLETGTVTVGSKVSIRNATAAGGSGAVALANPFVNDQYYKGYTLTSASSSSSVNYMVIANGDDSTTLVATVDASSLTAGFPFINVYINDSTMNGAVSGTWLLHGARYQGDPPSDPTT